MNKILIKLLLATISFFIACGFFAVLILSSSYFSANNGNFTIDDIFEGNIDNDYIDR